MYINNLTFIWYVCTWLCKYSLFIFIIYFYTWNSQPQTLSTNLRAHIDPIRLRGSWFHLYTPGSVDELRRCFCSQMLWIFSANACGYEVNFRLVFDAGRFLPRREIPVSSSLDSSCKTWIVQVWPSFFPPKTRAIGIICKYIVWFRSGTKHT